MITSYFSLIKLIILKNKGNLSSASKSNEIWSSRERWTRLWLASKLFVSYLTAAKRFKNLFWNAYLKYNFNTV